MSPRWHARGARSPGLAGWLLLAWALLLAPSADYQLFGGLPLSRPAELVALLLLAPLTASRTLRAAGARALAAWPVGVRRALAAVGVAALAIKVALLASGTHAGFLACYRSTLGPPPGGGPCERSFENPWRRFAVTRLDRAIAFEPRDWDLGFFNSRRFNFYVRRNRTDVRRRSRLPFEATWEGRVLRPDPWVARVRYVGEGRVVVGTGQETRATVLAAQYDAPAVVLVPVPAGPVTLRVEYRFDDGSTFERPEPSTPWATLRVERGRGPEGREPGAPVEAARPAWGWRAAATAGDALAIALLALPAFLYAWLCRREWWIALGTAAVGPLVYHWDPARLGLPASVGFGAALVLLALTVLGRHGRRRLLAAYFGVAYLTVFTALRSYPRLGVVTYREAGSDPLTYESFARAILDTWSLEAGEAVFFYQPLFRYIRFVERLLLGDGDGFVLIAALTAFHWALLWALARLGPPPGAAAWRRAGTVLVALPLLALATSAPIVFFVQVSLSEYPAWTFLPLLFPMWFASRSPRDWRRGAVLSALSFLNRNNHGPALLFQLALLGWRVGRARPGALAGVVGIVVALSSLAAVHNLYYGGTLAFTVRNPDRPSLLIIAPSQLPAILYDERVRRRAWHQIDHMFYLHEVRDRFPRGEPLSRAAFWSLSVLWLAGGAVALGRREVRLEAKLLLALPLAYLAPHLMFAVDHYYPRHIVSAHLAMAMVTLYVLGQGWRTSRPAATRVEAGTPRSAPPDSG